MLLLATTQAAPWPGSFAANAAYNSPQTSAHTNILSHTASIAHHPSPHATRLATSPPNPVTPPLHPLPHPHQAEAERLQGQKSLLSVMLNINSVLTDGAAAMVDDSFLKCFVNAQPDPWNWNFYLAPLW